jgi:hypothetical protein
MPINPFRPLTNYDIPNPPAPQGRFDPSVFSNIANLGESIGRYREQSQLADIARGAVDPTTGALDINKFAAGAAIAGHDPVRLLSLLETTRHQKEAESIARTTAEAAKTAAQRRQWQYVEEDPITGTPAHWLSSPDETGASKTAPVQRPAPATQPQPATPKPQSALPGGPSFASIEPNPEEAAPYRVAGPPMPPPQQVAQATPPAPATTAAQANPFETFLQTLPPSAQELYRNAAAYKTDPYKIPLDPKQRLRFFAKIQELVPGWSPENYALREEERKRTESLGQETEKQTLHQRGTEAAKLEADAVKDARAAADLQPLLDDVTRSWEALVNFRRFGGVQTGTGMLAGSEAARLPQRFLSTSEEQLRQGYERTLAALRARITGTMNQGQGAVSNYERQLYNQIFPEFTTSNPQGELATLRQLQQKNAQTIKIGAETELGKQQPGLFAERPAIERSQKQLFDEKTAAEYRKNPEITLNRARGLIQQGADAAQVRDALRAIDPKLADRL